MWILSVFFHWLENHDFKKLVDDDDDDDDDDDGSLFPVL